ncbi:MAG: protein kinase, partial [Planctomycetaceae bacterium]|nr:protein kinase [Planctomycetaceae bacterium]
MAENEKSLPFGMARKLDRICDRFEAEFQGGKQPRIEDYLTDAAGEEREALLKSLLQIELELLRRAGQEPDPAAYLSRFPGSPAVIDSVFTEHEQRTGQAADLSRTRIGPTPSAATGRKETISFGRASADTSTDLQQPRKDGTALSKGDTLGRFEILKVLGEGGFGRVYHANDPQLDREVALKVPHVAALGSPEMLERFMQEARSAANLLHANICPVHEIGEFDGQPYIVMAFIDGKSLSAFINPNKPLSERQVCLIVRKVALAIEAAHRSGVIHRDLKPDNIMIDRSRREPVVMDFGLARRETRGETQLTQVGQIMGTPTYMPPEQAKGDIENIGPHSDVYSLGVILYEMLTGERPFTGSIAEVLASILKDQPTPPSTHRPDLSPELEAICLKAMAKEPGGRFSSMAEFAHALGDFLKQAGTSGPNPVSRPGRTKEQQENEDHAGLTAFFEAPRLGKALDRYLSRKNAGLWSSRSPLTKILIGTAALALLAFLSVILFRTKHGTVQLEILDPSINVTFAGETITVDNDGKLIEITPGPHHLLVSYEGLEIPVEKPFEVKRGETTALRVTRIGSEVHVLQPGDPVPDSAPPPVTVASTELLHTLASDPAHVWDIAFSPDGNMIAAANDGSSVKIWNANTGELVHTLSEFESPVFCVAWSPDGKLLATGDSHRSTSGKQKSGTAALWSTSDWKKTTTVTDTKA